MVTLKLDGSFIPTATIYLVAAHSYNSGSLSLHVQRVSEALGQPIAMGLLTYLETEHEDRRGGGRMQGRRYLRECADKMTR